MSVQEMIQEAQTLSIEERRELIQALLEMLPDPLPVKTGQKRSLREFRGLGAHSYDGTDAQEYVNQLRNEWDDD